MPRGRDHLDVGLQARCGVKREPLCAGRSSEPGGCVPFFWAQGTPRIMGYFFLGLFIASLVYVYEFVTCLKISISLIKSRHALCQQKELWENVQKKKMLMGVS